MFVDRASRYITIMKTNLMHYLSLVYFVNQPVHILGMFVAYHQEVYCSIRSIPTRPTDSQLKSTTRTNCCVYTVYLLMMGYKYARNMYRLTDEIN